MFHQFKNTHSEFIFYTVCIWVWCRAGSCSIGSLEPGSRDKPDIHETFSKWKNAIIMCSLSSTTSSHSGVESIKGRRRKSVCGEDSQSRGACSVLSRRRERKCGESSRQDMCGEKRWRWIVDGMESLLNGWNLTGPKWQHDIEDNWRGSSVAESNHPSSRTLPLHPPSLDIIRLPIKSTLCRHTLLSGCKTSLSPRKVLFGLL